MTNEGKYDPKLQAAAAKQAGNSFLSQGKLHEAVKKYKPHFFVL